MLVCLLYDFGCDLMLGIVFVVSGLFIKVGLQVGKVCVSSRCILPCRSPCWLNNPEKSACISHYAEQGYVAVLACSIGLKDVVYDIAFGRDGVG